MIKTGECRVIVLHEFEKYGVKCLFVSQAAVAAGVELVLIEAMTDKFPEFYPED